MGKIKKRPTLTEKVRVSMREDQIAKVLKRPETGNPFLPIMLDMFEAALEQKPISENTPLAQIYNQSVLGKFPKSFLETVVKNYKSLPNTLQEKIAPRRANNLSFSPNVRIDISKVGRVTIKKDKVLPNPNPIKVGMFDAVYSKYALAELGLSIYGSDLLVNLPDLTDPDKIEPHIERILPHDEKNEFDPQETIRLVVRHPASESPSYKVIFTRHYQEIETKAIVYVDYATLTPKVKPLGKTKRRAILEVKLPSNFEDGHVRFAINSKESEKVVIGLKPQPPVTVTRQAILGSPEIVSISPAAGQLPGNKIILNVRNADIITVIDKGQLSTGGPVIASSTVAALAGTLRLNLIPSSNSGKIVILSVSIIKPTPEGGVGQIQATIPIDIIPGSYWLQLSTGTGIISLIPGAYTFKEGSSSLAVDYNVIPHKYRLNFNTIHCIDESDPEDVGIFSPLGNPGDEIVTHWNLAADQNAWFKSTGEYPNFDDNDTVSYSGSDSSVFMLDGSFGEVKIGFVLSTNLYESDEEDTKQAQGYANLIGKVGADIGELLLKLGQPTAAAIAAAVGAMAYSVSSLIGLSVGGYNFLGQQNLGWSAVDLQNLTNNAQKQHSGTLNFINNDKTGSYSLTYTIARLNQ